MASALAAKSRASRAPPPLYCPYLCGKIRRAAQNAALNAAPVLVYCTCRVFVCRHAASTFLHRFWPYAARRKKLSDPLYKRRRLKKKRLQRSWNSIGFCLPEDLPPKRTGAQICRPSRNSFSKAPSTAHQVYAEGYKNYPTLPKNASLARRILPCYHEKQPGGFTVCALKIGLTLYRKLKKI